MSEWKKSAWKYIKNPFLLICGAVILAVVLFLVLRGGFTVTFDTEGGNEVAAQKLRYGELVRKPEAPIKAGYDFVCWYQQDAAGIPWEFETWRVEKSITLVALWTPAQLIVDFDLNGGRTADGSEELAPLQVTYGEYYGEMPAPVKGDAIFAGWECGGQVITPETLVELTEDHVLTALWQ